ncbi:MAG: PDZ domain-containing protein [Bdellovibrionales bacterium]|nr:PDZ domain-containing protein [Bdellovibrionales bacterium]
MSLRAFKKLIGPVAAVAFSWGAHAEGLMCGTLPDLFRAYLASHYSAHEMTDDIKKHTTEQYIKSLDPSKTLLLEEDVVKLRKELPEVFGTMRANNCDKLYDAQKLLLQRAQEVEAYAKGFLNDSYKLDENVEIMTDSDKRGYAKSMKDREENQRKLMHFQISNYQLGDMKLAEAKKQLIHRYELITKRVRERKPEDVIVTYADSFATALDPHSTFFSRDALDEFRIDMSLSLEGIGASLSSQDGYTVVEEIIAGGAADRAKVLKPKDKIIAVAQEGEKPVPTIDMDLKDVVKMIRGKKGTKVLLTVLRQGEGTERLEFTIVRDKVSLKDQAAKLHVENRTVGKKKLKLGVIDLPSFYSEGEKGKRSSYTDVKKLLEDANKQKVDGVVLNLSHNGGGSLDDAVRMSGLFLKKGGIVATQNGLGRKAEILADEDTDTVYTGPLVVLTSRASASASEILSGALRDYKRAVIVGGDHTFGKGTVQTVVPLQGLGAVKVTIGMFFLPSGNTTQHQGVPGDVVLPSPLSTEEVGEQALDYSLKPQKIDSFLDPGANDDSTNKHWQPITAAETKALAEKSKARVDADKKFADIRKEIEESKKNKGILRLAEVLKKSKENKKKNKADEKKTQLQRLQDAEAPYINEALSVLGDLIEAKQPASGEVAKK